MRKQPELICPERYEDLQHHNEEYLATATRVSERGGMWMAGAGIASMAATITERYDLAHEAAVSSQAAFVGCLAMSGVLAIKRGKLWMVARDDQRELRYIEKRLGVQRTSE